MQPRLDKYLWAIRIFKTRAEAADAIHKGKVTCNGMPVKASRLVRIGDVYEVKAVARNWKIEVTGLIDKRVCFADAIVNYIDNTPVELQSVQHSEGFSEYTGKRLSKQGRPTKRNRRMLGDHGIL